MKKPTLVNKWDFVEHMKTKPKTEFKEDLAVPGQSMSIPEMVKRHINGTLQLREKQGRYDNVDDFVVDPLNTAKDLTDVEQAYSDLVQTASVRASQQAGAQSDGSTTQAQENEEESQN